MADFKFLDSSLSFDERTRALLSELTLEEKLGLLTAHMNAVPRLGLKEMYIGTEVARGLVCRNQKDGEFPTTVFPEPFGLAASFDPGIMSEMGEIAGVETRIYNKKQKCSLFVWGPTVDLERDPRWGRTEEGYGEDPCLTGTMAAAYTKGMAGNDEKFYRVIPTLKHFYANNNEDTRGRCNAVVPDRLKHEYYLRAFEKPVREGKAAAVMTSYNEVNGVEQLCSRELEFCRRQWGLLFAVTDGGDFVQNVQFHKRDRTHTEAFAKIYGNNGANIMTDDEELVKAAAKEALSLGLITEENLDKALFGALKARFLLGEFEKKPPFDFPEKLLCCEDYKKAAEKAAEKSVILLKNSRAILPLSDKRPLAVIGCAAEMNFRDWYTGLSPENPTILDALGSREDENSDCCSEGVVYDSGNDIIALRNASNGFYFTVSEDGSVKCDSPQLCSESLFELYEWGDGAVSLRSKANNLFLTDDGVLKCTAKEPYGWFVREAFYLERNGRDCIFRNFQKRFLYINDKKEIAVASSLRPLPCSVFNIELFSDGLERAGKIATETHQTVVFCGNNPMINARETKDRQHINLPERQRKIIDAVFNANRDSVLFMISGYPYGFDCENISAILHCAHGGPAMGKAVSGALFGDFSPAGRCPVTWYSSEKELCDIEDYNIIRTGSTYQYYEGKPLFAFGHGLSYTGFRYGAAVCDKNCYKSGDIITVTLELENIGGMSSDEVVQLYAAFPNELPISKPKIKLTAFERVFVPHGERAVVTLKFNADDLALWNAYGQRFELYGGAYTLHVGASSEDIRKTLEIRINGIDFDGYDVEQFVPASAALDYVGVRLDAAPDLTEYALINDWQSSITFEACRLRGYNKIKLYASNPGGKTKITVTAKETGQLIAEAEIPPTGSLSEFTTVTSQAQPIDGIFSLVVASGGMLSLKGFEFIQGVL